MLNIKKILISAVISLAIILISTCILNIISNNDVLEIPIVVKEIEEGKPLKENIAYVEVKINNIKKEVLDNVASKDEIEKMVSSKRILKGEIVLKDNIVVKEDYLIKVENLEYVSLPIKGATEGISYKIKKGDKINVYYTAKRKMVDGMLKNKIRVYSSNKEETMVTCLLYKNVEVIALTNNMGITVTDGTATDILVRLKSEEILELANLKEQGIFTYSLI